MSTDALKTSVFLTYVRTTCFTEDTKNVACCMSACPHRQSIDSVVVNVVASVVVAVVKVAVVVVVHARVMIVYLVIRTPHLRES